jgi:phospholipid transport system substrate-binding protein
MAALLGLAVFIVTSLPAGGVFAAELEARAEQFIRSLAEEAMQSLTKPDTPREIRVKNFRKLFKAHFGVRSIGRFVLGRHWRKATDAEKKEYLGLFEDLMVISYVDRFQRYAGENLNIIKARAERANAATVFTEIARPNTAKPVQVLWRVGTRGETTKILDVVVEGASMSQTLRSDFGSIIRQKGGRIAGLLEVLRVKTAALKGEAKN